MNAPIRAVLAAAVIFVAPPVFAQSQQSYDSRGLSIENFIGRIEVRTGTGSQVVVRVEPGSGGHDRPDVALRGGVVIIDGGQNMSGRNCSRRGGEIHVGAGGRFLGLFGGSGGGALSEFPALIVEAPAGVNLSINRSIYQGAAGDLGDAAVRVNGCGDFRINAIAGDADLAINGSGDLHTGPVGGEARLSVNGSGDLYAGDIAGAARISINGSGDVRVASLRDARLSINGSGDIHAGRQDGAFSAGINGSGDIRIAEGRAQPFAASINGSGDVRYGGEAVDATVAIRGSGSVTAGTFSGAMNWTGRGSGRVRSAN